MASEDVIELGSSDDEAEPASKKRKTLPNAMVHIPNKLPGVTIKLSKSNQFYKHKGVSPKPNSKSVYNATNQAHSKSVYNVNSNVIKNKQLGGAFQTPIKIFPRSLKTQLSVTKKCGLNPLNLNKNLNRPQLSVPLKTVTNPTKVKGSKLLNNLPPGITIKLIQNAGGSDITKQCKMTAPPNTVEVLTVELDDEETSETTTATTASPQWYLRPEEPSEKPEPLEKQEPSEKQKAEEQTKEESKAADSMEEQNNKEPESTKFVEITIEDSPLKHLPAIHDSEIGKELSITIEDSPAKVIKHISNNDASDHENYVKKIPHSKKKLDYPKQVVEIEIEPMGPASVPVEVSDDKDLTKNNIINKEDKIIKHDNAPPNDDCQTKDNVDSTSNTEFHPVYQNFINMCFKLENSEDMIKIVEKKVKAYYKQCPKEYVESEDFIDMVSSKIVSMKTDPEKMYLYIKDIVDELNLQRKMAKSTIITKKEDLTEDSSIVPEHDGSSYNSKKRDQIQKLEKTIKKLHRAIQKFEEQEVDFDDDEDSVYLLTERYKERMVRVHKKFCQLTNTKMPSEPRIHIESRPGRPTGPARKLEKWVNKKVPVGSLLPFPDFHDVLRCVRDSNDEDKLGWNEYEIMEEARDLFTRCGKKLQRRRQENEWRLAVSRISQSADPAEKNTDLNKQLDDNRAVATSKEVELLNKFAEKQNELKLEAVEIGDKEAEESPVESDEEEEEVNVIPNSLEEKQKRKDKLKKLLQEDGKKNVEKVNDSVPLKGTKTENEIVYNEEAEKQINETEKTEHSKPNSEMNTENPYILNACPEKNEVILEKIEGDQTQPGNESDSDKVESDIDELHLYQKSRKSFSHAHNASSFESSDSDSPIAISDTLDSDSDVETDKKLSDIISIENSSYSESESTNYNTFPYDDMKNVENLINARLEVEFSKVENADHVENILLASSDEEDTNKVVGEEIDDTFINLKDDNISISETMVYGKTVEQDIVHNEQLFSPEINIPTTALQESPTNSEENMIIQEYYEEDQNSSLRDTAIEINKDNEEINSNDSPKEIVDIGSVSDGTSIASIEMQIDADSKVADQIEVLDQLGTGETEVNESSCDSRISEAVDPIS